MSVVTRTSYLFLNLKSQLFHQQIFSIHPNSQEILSLKTEILDQKAPVWSQEWLVLSCTLIQGSGVHAIKKLINQSYELSSSQ